ncbi:MAG: hypothetical protein QMD22_04815 [archaeon]|nr:hypothetical protein [archaeon]
MPSQIAQILGEYEDALNISKDRYEKMYKERFKNAGEFYDVFFKNLIKDYGILINNLSEIRRIIRSIEQLFGTRDIKFAAIDGTCFKEVLENYMIFFGASYCVKGNIALTGKPPSIKYERYSTEWDTSMVAYIPIPFAELSDITENQFISSDDDKIIYLLSIHS